jgi:hypothetical protein
LFGSGTPRLRYEGARKQQSERDTAAEPAAGDERCHVSPLRDQKRRLTAGGEFADNVDCAAYVISSYRRNSGAQ